MNFTEQCEKNECVDIGISECKDYLSYNQKTWMEIEGIDTPKMNPQAWVRELM